MAIRQDTSAATGKTTPRDPLTDAPDFHPVGTGVGAAAGGMAAGAAVGTVAGPVGTVIGAAAGAVAGGLAGKALARNIDIDEEDAYWREYFTREPYVGDSPTYEDYGPAYRYGATTYNSYAGRKWEDVEDDLGRGWDESRERSTLDWGRAKHATRASWQRIQNTFERAMPGDSDRDGL
ncbi:MAG: hypothetical protein QM742_08540 [Aquabacterium sp.]